MVKPKFAPFGVHLMLEAYNCSPRMLRDANIAYKILDELPEKIHMTKMTLPYVVFTPGNDHKDPGGWSGFVIIQESHISLHTFVKRRFVTVDVYSCKEFDTKVTVEYLKKIFKTDEIEYKVEIRGKRYPQENID